MGAEFAQVRETVSVRDLDGPVRRAGDTEAHQHSTHDHEQPAPAFGGGLMVGAADDRAELEADDIAHRVVQRLAAAAAPPDPPGGGASGGSGAGGGGADGPGSGAGGDAPVVGRAGGDAGAAVTAAIESRRGSGAPLPGPLRERYEGAMGSSFAGVRIHTDDAAARISRSISAQAFTVGSDIFFGAGAYAPGTPAGQRTLAHELAHTQQNGSAPVGRAVRRLHDELLEKMSRPLPPTPGELANPADPGAAPAPGGAGGGATPGMVAKMRRPLPPTPGDAPAPGGAGGGATPGMAAKMRRPLPPTPTELASAGPDATPAMVVKTRKPLPPTPVEMAAAGPDATPALVAKMRRPLPATPSPPASPEKLARARTRSRDLIAQVGMAGESIRARIAPDAVMPKLDGVFQTMSVTAADEVLASTVKPVVLGAAVKKLVTKAKSKQTDTIGDNIYETYAKMIAEGLVKARLAELVEMEKEVAADPSQFAVSDAARIKRARAALGGAERAYRAPKVNKDQVVAASRTLITALVDAKMYAVADSEAALAAFYKDTKPDLTKAALDGLKGTGHLVPRLTAEISAQIGQWMHELRELAAEAQGGYGETEAEIDAAIASMNKIAGESSTFLAQIDTTIPKLFDGNPRVEAVALETATTAAGPISAAAADKLRTYMGSTAAVKKRMLVLASGADKGVLDELKSLQAGASAPSDDGAASIERVRDQIRGTSEGATSKLKAVGSLLDVLLDGPSKAGGATSLETVVRIPVPVAPGAFVGFRLKLEGSNTHATTSGREQRTVSAELGVQAGGGLPLAGSVCVELGGYLRGSGRTASEAMEFISFALYRRFRESPSVPRSITNALWGMGGVTAKAGGDAGAAKYAEAEAWGTGMEDRLRESGGSAETGAYGAAKFELGINPASGMAGTEGALGFSAGTKYSSSIVDNRRAQGAGTKPDTQYGAQQSVGQARRNLMLSGSAAAAGFGAAGQATLSWGLRKAPGADDASYGFENLDIRFSGIGRKPPTEPFADDKNTALTIANWAGSLLTAIRYLRGKMQKAKENTIDGEMGGADKGLTKGKFAPIAYDINDKTGASDVAQGFIETIRDKAASGIGAAAEGAAGLLPGSGGGGGGGSGPLSEASGAVKGAASTAADYAGTGAAVAKDQIAAGAAWAGNAVSSGKQALGYASSAGLHLTARYQLTKNGDAFDHVLDISFGTQSKLSINVAGVRVVYASTTNLVTVMLLPERKVLT